MGSQADKVHFTVFYKIGGKFTKKMGKEMEGHKKKKSRNGDHSGLFQRHEKKYYFLDKKSLICVDSTIASLNV